MTYPMNFRSAGDGGSMRLDEGAMGKREQAVEQARAAGVLGQQTGQNGRGQRKQQHPRIHGRAHHHFGCLVKNIEMMFETGRAPYPVERTMLTSGILDFALESRIQGCKKLDTVELAKVRYQTPNASHFCTKGWGPDGKRLDM